MSLLALVMLHSPMRGRSCNRVAAFFSSQPSGMISVQPTLRDARQDFDEMSESPLGNSQQEGNEADVANGSRSS